MEKNKKNNYDENDKKNSRQKNDDEKIFENKQKKFNVLWQRFFQRNN